MVQQYDLVVLTIKYEVLVNSVIGKEVRYAPAQLLEHLEASHDNGFVLHGHVLVWVLFVLLDATIDQPVWLEDVFLLDD